MTLDVDALAQEIRRVDGKHDLGAGQLAEALMPFLASLSGGTPGKEGVREIVPSRRLEALIGLDSASSSEVHDMAVELIVRRRSAPSVAPTTMHPCEKHPDRYCNCEGFYPACREARKS